MPRASFRFKAEPAQAENGVFHRQDGHLLEPGLWGTLSLWVWFFVPNRRRMDCVKQKT